MAQITVGCKLPHGIHMDVDGRRVTLNGSNSASIVDTDGVKTGLTTVDKDFYEHWISIHKDAPYIKGGLIFANENPGKVKGEAAEKKKIKTGFEGLDGDKPAKDITKADGK